MQESNHNDERIIVGQSREIFVLKDVISIYQEQEKNLQKSVSSILNNSKISFEAKEIIRETLRLNENGFVRDDIKF